VQFLLHLRSGELHPSHRFFSRRNAEQMAQFIPQGATSVVLNGFFAAIVENKSRP